MQQGYQQFVPTKTTTTTTTTTQKPIMLVEKSVLPPLGEIPSPLMKLNEIPNGITKGMINFNGICSMIWKWRWEDVSYFSNISALSTNTYIFCKW